MLARPLVRYVLFQIPGWILAAALVYWLWPRTGLEPWLGGLALVAWVVKDFVMWPLVRVGYQTDVRHGAAELVGETAVVQTRLNPVGSVRIRGELWKARTEDDSDASLEGGTAVEVVGVAGMTLLVRVSPAQS